MKYIIFARLFMEFWQPIYELFRLLEMRNGTLDLHTRSSCSKMHECRSSSMSLYLRA